MKCPGCHKDISDQAKFCGFCGFRMESYPSQPDEKPPVDEQTGFKLKGSESDPASDEAAYNEAAYNDQDDPGSRSSGFSWSSWKIRILLGGAAALILVATVGILIVLKSEKHYWKKEVLGKEQAEERYYASKRYLIEYPEGQYGRDAAKIIDLFEFNDAVSKNSIPLLIAYTQSHPEGMNIKEARTRIAEHERILRELKARQRREDSARKVIEAKEKARKEAELAGIPGTYPQASFRVLLEAELFSLSDWELRVMRNEIFARHGYIFKTAAMKNHFKDLGWYRATDKLPYNNNASDLLTDIEKQNIQLIQKVEKR